MKLNPEALHDLPAELKLNPEALHDLPAELKLNPEALHDLPAELKLNPEALHDLPAELKLNPEALHDLPAELKLNPEALHDLPAEFVRAEPWQHFRPGGDTSLSYRPVLPEDWTARPEHGPTGSSLDGSSHSPRASADGLHGSGRVKVV
ncbi:hypothetical protein [Sorangium sp. So ce1000]|uniref:hypothetical protein n=1 Tax=Sorangium sp. So ce1000 TaxID=3133325 RepID=UPI003F5D6F1B